MRQALQDFLNRTWYENRAPGFILSGLEHVYHSLSSLHRRWGRRRAASDLRHWPIVVVGNLTAGGAGKTPLVIRLCELAQACGLQAGVISRGYGRTSHAPLDVSGDTAPYDAGDEPLLIARRSGAPVRVDANRERAARELFRQKVDLVISDDGLQRTRLPRQLELCVIDSVRGFGNGRLLPAGPLREPVSRLESIDFVIEHLPAARHEAAAQGYYMYLEAGQLQHLHDDRTLTLEALLQSGKAIHAVAGISRPARFFEMLNRLGIQTINHPFPDHHHFQSADFKNIPADSIVLMTEKDAVKCRKLALFNAWVVPVDAVLSKPLELALTEAFSKFKRAGEGRSLEH